MYIGEDQYDWEAVRRERGYGIFAVETRWETGSCQVIVWGNTISVHGKPRTDNETAQLARTDNTPPR